jgi:hypothetical protein
MPLLRGVANGSHNDGYRCGGLLRGEHGVGPPSNYDVYVEADEVIRQLGKSLVVTLGVAVLEAKVLALDIPEIIESPSKRVDGRPGLDRQNTDRGYFSFRLLRARHERPRGCRATEQREELATPDASCHLIPPPEGGRSHYLDKILYPPTNRVYGIFWTGQDLTRA